MKEFPLQDIISSYGIQPQSIEPFGTGLINHTWKITSGNSQFILQRINHRVFKQPEKISDNIMMVGDYLAASQPSYLFPTPLKTIEGSGMVVEDGNYFRIFPFIKNSITLQVAKSAEDANEAALKFSEFAYLLKDFPVDKLNITIPDFHNLNLRFDQFIEAGRNGNPDRIKHAGYWIDFLRDQVYVLEEYKKVLQEGSLKKRVMHHDTKISNVLFDNHRKGLCVIDLDTMMPGFFMSDLGDMMRTYLSPANEEVTDFNKVQVRKEFYDAICEGYSHFMADELTTSEKTHFHFAGSFMIYMQALRFMTDFLLNDVYYGATYPDHNFNRAVNQSKLFQEYQKLG